MSTSDPKAEAQEERFIRFAETLPDAILLVSASGRIVGGNTAARSLFGETAATLNELASGDASEAMRMMSRSRSPLSCALTLRTAEGALVRFRCDGALVRARDGATEPLISVRFRPRDSASSRFIELNSKIDALDREIGTRRRIEALLRAHAETLEMITTDVPLATVLERLVTTIEHDVPEPVAASILLYDRVTNSLRHGAAPNLPAEYRDAVDGIAAGPAVGSCGTAAFRRERVIVNDIASDPLWREYRDLALTHGLCACWSEPIMSSAGEVLGTFAVYRTTPGAPPERERETVALLTRTASIAIERTADEAARAELLERERLARAEAEQANRAKDEFLATVSHELRTPLTAILGWASLLKDQQPGIEMGEAVGAITASARAQAQIIEDLLDFSRIAADRLQIRRSDVDIAAVIQEAVATVRPSADATGVRLDVQLADMQRTVEGDADRLRQIVWNLLTNAIKFAPGGRVVVRLSADDDGASIAVTDDGEGIPESFLTKVFDRFSQADATSKRRHGGLGLGLAIVHRLVELHGGTITAASKGEGKGATFTVRLPYSASLRTHAAAQPPVTVRRPAELLPLDGLRVLLVEDELSSLEAFRRILARAGADVTPASSAIEALSACRETRPDLIVSDIGMPGMDGYELLRQIREAPTVAGVPAIALTAYAQKADGERAIASGFNAHIAKPVSADQLVMAVLRLAQRSSTRSLEQVRPHEP